MGRDRAEPGGKDDGLHRERDALGHVGRGRGDRHHRHHQATDGPGPPTECIAPSLGSDFRVSGGPASVGEIHGAPRVVDDHAEEDGDRQVGEEDEVARDDVLEDREGTQPWTRGRRQEQGGERQEPEEPQDPLPPPDQRTGDTHDEHADPEELGGQHRPLIAPDDPEERRTEGAVGRRLGWQEEPLGIAPEGAQVEARMDRAGVVRRAGDDEPHRIGEEDAGRERRDHEADAGGSGVNPECIRIAVGRRR